MQIERAQEVGLLKPNASQKNIFQGLLLFKKKIENARTLTKPLGNIYAFVTRRLSLSRRV
jgi:hypothetical protein